MSIPKAVVRHTRITFTALYCSKVMYSVGCYVYSSHYRLKKSDKRYFFALQPSAYMSFNKSVMLVSLFPLSLLNPYKSLIYSCFNCLECSADNRPFREILPLVMCLTYYSSYFSAFSSPRIKSSKFSANVVILKSDS